MEDIVLKEGMALKNSHGDLIKQGEMLKKSRIKRQATSRLVTKSGSFSNNSLKVPVSKNVGFKKVSSNKVRDVDDTESSSNDGMELI